MAGLQRLDEAGSGLVAGAGAVRQAQPPGLAAARAARRLSHLLERGQRRRATLLHRAPRVLIPRRGDARRHAHGAVVSLTVAARRYAPSAQIVLVSSFAAGYGPAHPLNRLSGSPFGRQGAERALRASGLPWTIVRPTWLTDDPDDAHALTLTQDPHADGMLGRADLAAALVAAVEQPAARHTTFALYNEPGRPSRDWGRMFASLTPDAESPACPHCPRPSHAWESTLRADDRGRPTAPGFHRLLMLDVRRAPTAADAERLESSLCALEQRFVRGPGGLLTCLGWGAGWFERYTPLHSPVGRPVPMAAWEDPGAGGHRRLPAPRQRRRGAPVLASMLGLLDPDAPVGRELTALFGSGDVAVAEWTAHATARGGERYENSYCGVFETSDGKVTAVREYLDTQRMGAVLFGR